MYAITILIIKLGKLLFRDLKSHTQFTQLCYIVYYATIFYCLLLMDTQRTMHPQHLTQCLA